jgi:hypothetical protein
MTQVESKYTRTPMQQGREHHVITEKNLFAQMDKMRWSVTDESKKVTEASEAYTPPSAELRGLEMAALQAVRAKVGAGYLHRSSPRADRRPPSTTEANTKFNPLYRFSSTASSWADADPRGPYKPMNASTPRPG